MGGFGNFVNKTAVALHLKKREGHIKTAGTTRTIIPDGETTAPIEAATAPKLTAAGAPELGGTVGTATVPGYAAPSTPLNDPETWQGPKVPPISSRMDAKRT